MRRVVRLRRKATSVGARWRGGASCRGNNSGCTAGASGSAGLLRGMERRVGARWCGSAVRGVVEAACWGAAAQSDDAAARSRLRGDPGGAMVLEWLQASGFTSGPVRALYSSLMLPRLLSTIIGDLAKVNC
ncbi:hypothetical protein EJB05_03212, partial [Eragrostis curvula]